MLRLALFIAALLIAMICGVVAAAATSDMAGRVNDRLPLEERKPFRHWSRFSDVFGYPPDRSLHREYRRLYPDGPLARRVYVAFAVALVALVAAAALAGIVR